MGSVASASKCGTIFLHYLKYFGCTYLPWKMSFAAGCKLISDKGRDPVEVISTRHYVAPLEGKKEAVFFFFLENYKEAYLNKKRL